MSALRAAPRAAAHSKKRGACERTLRLKVEQRRRGAVARQLQALVAQLVEEGHRASLEGLDARVGRIAQEARDQLDGVRRRAGAEDLVPRVRLDLRDERGSGGRCEGRGLRTEGEAAAASSAGGRAPEGTCTRYSFGSSPGSPPGWVCRAPAAHGTANTSAKRVLGCRRCAQRALALTARIALPGLTSLPRPRPPPCALSLARARHTLMISTSWSTPDSPGKSGTPRSSSASTQPTDQTSMQHV